MTSPSNPTTPQCLITGCALIRPDGLWTPVDLHQLGDVYFFRPPQDNSRETFWNDPEVTPIFYAKTVKLNIGSHWVDRRGVILVHKSEATLNDAAQAYIAGAQQ